MSIPLLSTKFNIPPTGAKFVRRQRLLRILDEGPGAKCLPDPGLRAGRLWQDDARQRVAADLAEDPSRPVCLADAGIAGMMT